MRVATFNLLHGRSPDDGLVDVDRLAAAVRRLDADVLGLQEVDRGQERSHRADLTAVADAGTLGFRYPVRLIRPGGGAPAQGTLGYSFYGPTCDSADVMAGPFELPDDVAEGDWIEIGQLGAYGGCFRTSFNGFDRARLVEVADAPLAGESAPAAVRLAA